MNTSTNDRLDTGTIEVRYQDSCGDRLYIANAPIMLRPIDARSPAVDKRKNVTEQPEGIKSVKSVENLSVCRTAHEGVTDSDGLYRCKVKPGWWAICTTVFGIEAVDEVKVEAGCTSQIRREFDLGISGDTVILNKECTMTPCRDIRKGQSMLLKVCWNLGLGEDLEIMASATKGNISNTSRLIKEKNQYCREFVYFASGSHGTSDITYRATSNPHVEGHIEINVFVDVQNISGDNTVTLTRTETSFYRRHGVLDRDS